jgi:hypothetical protein
MTGLEGKRTTVAPDDLGDAPSKVNQNRSSVNACCQPLPSGPILRPRFLIGRSKGPPELARDHTCLCLLSCEGLQGPYIFLRPPSNWNSWRALSSRVGGFRKPRTCEKAFEGAFTNNGWGITPVKVIGRPEVCCCGEKEAPIPEKLGTGAQVQVNCQPESPPRRQRRSTRCRERPNEDQVEPTG